MKTSTPRVNRRRAKVNTKRQRYTSDLRRGKAQGRITKGALKKMRK